MQIFSIYKNSLNILPSAQRKKFKIFVIFQFLSSLLDLIAVLSMGILTLEAVASTSNKNGIIYNLLEYMRGSITGEKQLLLFLSVITICLFLLKSFVSLYLAHAVFRFLEQQSLKISDDLFKKLLRHSLIFIQKTPNQELISGLNVGITNTIVVILGCASIVLSELFLLLVLATGLIIIDPTLTLILITYFLFIVFFLQKIISPMTTRSGRGVAVGNTESSVAIQQAIDTFREIYISNTANYSARKFLKIRTQGAQFFTELLFATVIPKYIMECAMIIGAGLLIGLELLRSTPSAALGILAIFIAASSRMLPSILRIQNALSGIYGAVGYQEYSLNLIKKLANTSQDLSNSARTLVHDKGNLFTADIVLTSVAVVYPGQDLPAISDITFNISPGSSIAIVGPSGAGKSTLIDVILGLVEPTKGQVTLSGIEPRSAIEKWPGCVGYVPQSVALFDGPLRENIAFGIHPDEIDDDKLWKAISKSHLMEFVKNCPKGIHSSIGDHGIIVSGGERQRLGIARALYTDPKLLILDEATSSLDAETEDLISQSLFTLAQGLTRITIAHRLNTIRNVDLIIYLENGRLLAAGKFNEIRKSIPQFERQIQLFNS